MKTTAANLLLVLVLCPGLLVDVVHAFQPVAGLNTAGGGLRTSSFCEFHTSRSLTLLQAFHRPPCTESTTRDSDDKSRTAPFQCLKRRLSSTLKRFRVSTSWRQCFVSWAALLLVWTTVVSGRNIVTDTTTTFTAFPRSTTVVATVVPTKYRKETMPRPQSVIHNPPLLRIVTTGGLVGIAILGGQHLGYKMLPQSSSNHTTAASEGTEQNDDDSYTPDLPSAENGMSPPRSDNASSSTAQRVNREEIGRQMVQKILQEQETKTTNGTGLPTTSPPHTSPYLPMDATVPSQRIRNTSRVTRSQPLPLREELDLQNRYAAIPDLSDRAYQILVDLGMV